MSDWKITGFLGINNMKEPSALEQPNVTKTGNYGDVELRRCINFDIDDDNGLVKRDNDQVIFDMEYDAKLTQSFAGITYTALGNRLTFSKAFSTDSDPRRNAIEYTNPIVLIQEVEVGMWVSTTEKLIFHSGRNPTIVGGFTQTAEYNFPAIMGTGEKVHSSKLGLDNDGFVALFTTTRGICYGTQTGMLVNMSEGKFSYKPFQRGISYIKEANGMIQYQVKMINSFEDSFNEQGRKVAIEVDAL